MAFDTRQPYRSARGASLDEGKVPVAVTPRPFTSAAPTWLEVAAGSTVRAALVQAVNAGALPADDLPRTLAATRIVIDGLTLPRETALDHVLQRGQVAAIDVCGAGGGGGSKDVGQVLLTLAVIAVSAWVGGPAGAGLGLKSAFLRTVASATVMALGQAAVAGLYAPEREAQSKTADRFALQGASNQYRPWAPFPIALGEVVVAPDFAVKTFTKTQGDDVWLHGILGLHYGPCVVSELKIGDTLVSSMGAGDVQVVEHLTPGPRTFTLHPNDVDQLDLQEKLEADTATATPVVRVGSAEGERFEFDFFLPSGLHYQKDDGRRVSASVTLSVRSRPVDENGVPTGGGAWSGATSWTLTSTTKEPWRVTRGISLPLGRYEFDVRRSVRIDLNEKRRDEVAITAIRAIAYRKPIVDETLSLIEFAVRATALNQGTLAPITCRLTPKCPVWDAAAAGGAGAWTAPTPTSNPAALTRWLMTGPAPARPLATSEADARLRTWFALCETHDWAAGIYLTETRSQADVLALLESAGRAGVFWDGAQLAAAPWVEKPAPRQLFAGANLRNHRWQILYPEPVHALRVEFQNLDEGGAPDELYVYADGYAETAGPGVEAATLIEALRLEGQKRPERAYRDGRWALGQRKLQRRIDSWETDVEHLASSYGDRVRLSYGRIEEANPVRVRCRRWSGASVSGLRLSAPVRFEPGLSYAVDLRRAGGLDAAVPVVNPAVAEIVETREIVFAVARTEATSPKADDLVAFGQTALISEDVELIGVDPAEGLTARLTAMRYVAPELMAGETGPIPDLVSRLTRARMAAPTAPRLLGVQADPQGVRVSFDLPPWSGSPIAGFAARWRPTPAFGQDAGWIALPPLDPTARVLVTPPPRALAAEAGDVEGETRIDVEIRAFTEAGQASPVPLTVSSILVRAEPFAPLGLTVTPATRPAPDGSSHAVLVVALDPLAVAEGVDILLECRRSPVGAAPDAWESAGLALDVRNPTGDVLGLRGGERYGFRAALRDGAGWASTWTAEVFGTVPSGTSTVPREARRRALDLQLADRLTRFESWLTETERRRRVDRDLRDVVDVVIGDVDPVTRTGRLRFGDLFLGETAQTLEDRFVAVDDFAGQTRTDFDGFSADVGDTTTLFRRAGGGFYTGDLNATHGAGWGTNLTGRPAELTDGRIAAGLAANGDLARNIPTTILNGSNVLRYTGGGAFTGDLNATHGASWGGNLTGRPTELTDGRVSTALSASGVLQTAIPSTLADTSNLMRRTGGGLYTGALNATAGADWGTNVTGRPTELTDGRIGAGLAADGRLLQSTLSDGSEIKNEALQTQLEEGTVRPIALAQGAAVKLSASLYEAVQAQSYKVYAGDGETVSFGRTYGTPPVVIPCSLDNLLLGDFGAGDYPVTEPVNVTTTGFTGRARRKNNGSGGTPVTRVDEGAGDRMIESSERIYRQKELSGVAANGNYVAAFTIRTKTPSTGVPPNQEPGTPRTMTVGLFGRRTAGGAWQLLGQQSYTSDAMSFLAQTADVTITGNTDWSTWNVYSGSGEAQYEYKLEVISGYILNQMELVDFTSVTWVENTGASGAVDVTALPAGGKLTYLVIPQTSGAVAAPE
jgi:hypothetical protein